MLKLKNNDVHLSIFSWLPTIHLGHRWHFYLGNILWHPKQPIYGKCKQRGVCCQNVAVGVSKRINNIPILLKVINWWYRFVYNFTLKGWYKNDQIMIYSCNYLKNGKCSIYWRRPLICREYPRSKRIGQTTMPGCGYSLQPSDPL